MKRAIVAFSGLPVLFLALSGCGGAVGDADFPETAPVTGSVTLDGQPVEGAQITLVPANESGDGYSARATSGADGSFTVSTYFSASSDEPGAVPGTYNVMVTKYASTTGPAGAHGATSAPSPASQHVAESSNELPAKYGVASESGLAITVKDGENTLPIALESE